MNRFRYFMFVLTAIMVLVLSAITAAPALADDVAPPPTDAPVVVEVVSTEVPAVVQEPAPVAETLASVPEGTDVVVTDANGESLPLVSSEAAQAIDIIDPIWCPVGVTPKDGLGGCTTSYASLKLLVDYLAAGTAGVNPAANGIIWIEGGTDSDVSGTPILIDGSAIVYNTWENFSLTLKGGWNGLNTTTVNLNNPSVVDQSISIINWKGDITLTDIVFSGVTTGSSSHTAALNIETTKNVVLTNVNATGNTGVNGVFIDARDGVPSPVASMVTITNGTYSNNSGATSTGLTVFSDGAITLKDVTASANGDNGIFVTNTDAVILAGVNLTGSTLTTGNGDAGLTVNSKGAILASNLISNGNTNSGVYLDNTSGAGQAVTITGSSNQMKYNTGVGLYILSKGVITVNSITATENGNVGVYLDNSSASTSAPKAVFVNGTNTTFHNANAGLSIFSVGAVTVNNLSSTYNYFSNPDGLFINNINNILPQSVTLLGTFNLSHNAQYGLTINTSGAVIAGNITASNNGFSGASIGNTFGSSGSPVTLSGTNIFNTNGSTGLEVYSKGIITVNNLTVKDNNDVGVYLSNISASTSTPKAVFVNGINTISNNAGTGLEIQSVGAVTVSNLSSTLNTTGGLGLNINNVNIPLPQNVTLLGTMNLSDNNGNGLTITTSGAVTAGNITANNNTGRGANIDNTSGTANPVTLSGAVNTFDSNSNFNLYVSSNGLITVNNLIANNSVASGGALLSNDGAASALGVNVTGTSSFNNNHLTGLSVYSKGNVVIYNFTASNNNYTDYSNGIYVDNYAGGSGTGNVTLGTTLANWINHADNNYDRGIYIGSNGTVTLFNVSASGNGYGPSTPGGSNGGGGLYIDNTSAVTPKSVTLNGVNTFNDNYETGLSINSKGAIVVTKVTANGNNSASSNDNGAYLFNRYNSSVPQNISVLGYGEFSNNGINGLTIGTYGAVSLANITASHNTNHGIFVDNQTSATLPRNITQTGYLTAEWNGVDGVDILSLGAISLNNLAASHSITGYGAYLNNNSAGAVGGITIGGYADTFFTVSTGLFASSRGNISITNLSSAHNLYGAELYNNGFTGTVSLLGTRNLADNNTSSGIYILSSRAVTVSNLYADNNGAYGVFIDNSTPGAALPQNVTINGSNTFTNNGRYGLYVFTYGAILANNLTANANGQINNPALGLNGVELNNCVLTINCAAITAKNVTITGTNNFNDNKGSGLEVLSKGVITVNAITATGNTVDGAYLSNQQATTPTTNGITLTGTNTFNANGTGLAGVFQRRSEPCQPECQREYTSYSGCYYQHRQHNCEGGFGQHHRNQCIQ
ncbi:MAG: hypothetical protein U0Z26_00785 [Anaerolineales bacterium]